MNRGNLSKLLTIAAVAVLIVIYFVPAWWVSLKAPNYPPEAFPDGIRIHFHMNGVFNGCTLVESKEIQEDEVLNCVHEMDTINHYVGMYPIGSAAPIERAFSSFLFAFLIVMLLGFAMHTNKSRITTMSLGFGIIATWMLTALFTKGGIMYTSTGYIESIRFALDLDLDDIKDWTAAHAILESYKDTLGVYFRDPVEIARRVGILSNIMYTFLGVLLVAMPVLIIGAWKTRFFYWFLIVIPILFPVIFILDYAGWLWWFGHTLNEMGAFSIKPFMPTVFGDGKVAQFSTHSYPHYGFGLMLVSSSLLLLASLLRRKQLKEAS
jgi:hypothetical protein